MNQLPRQQKDILINVDVQNDFISGSLAITDGENVVAPLNSVAALIRGTENGTVIHTRDWHPAKTPHFETWPPHCVAHTDGAAFHPDLTVLPGDIILSKGMGQTDGYSGWEGVNQEGGTLETIIAPQAVGEKVRVFIGGLATDYCVRATALDIAHSFGENERVELYLLRDAIRAVGIQPDDEQNALDAMQEAMLIAITCDQARAIIEGGV